jgi:Icc-related predicted phosphoesterase
MRILNWNPTPIHEVSYLVARKGGGATDVATLAITLARITDLPATLEGLIFTGDLQGRELLPPTNRQRRAGTFRYREGRRLLGEVVAEHLRRLCDRGDIPAADKLGIVLAGDFWAEPGSTRRGGLGKVGPVWAALGGTSRWVAGVLGNHDQYDGPRHDESNPRGPRKVALLDGDIVDMDGCRLGGVSGIIGDPFKPRRKSERRYLDLLEGILRDQPDIVVLHEPPEIPEAGCRGKASVRDCLVAQPPTLLVCGHCHWRAPLQTLPNGTQVCNVDARLIVALR